MPHVQPAFRLFLERYVRALWICLVGVSLFGCSLPEYRLIVSSIPSAAQKLEVAAYLPQVSGQSSAVPTDQISADVKSGSTTMTLTINLEGAYEKPKQAVFAAVARDAQGCVVGLGTSLPAEPSSVVADVELGLWKPKVASASRERCSATGPILSDVQRQERGHYGQSDFRLNIRGWNLDSKDRWTVKSKYIIDSTRCLLASCRNVCQDTIGCRDAAGGMATCRTGCQLVVSPEYVNPGLTVLHISDADNQIADMLPGDGFRVEAVSLSGMRGFPFEITLSRPTGGQTARYTEPSR